MFFLSLLVPLIIFSTLGFGLAYTKKDNSIADILWGLYFILLAGTAFLLSDTPDLRKILVLTLICIWGLRLSVHIFLRHRGKGEDPRYTEMKKNWKWIAVRSYFQVFILQDALATIILAPQLWLMSQSSAGELGILDLLGLGIWMFGFTFEVVSDAQLSNFTKIKKPGQIMKTGLWKRSRHPNYFGEVTQWWGLFLMALSVPFGWAFFFGPLTITLLILFVSGVPMLEKRYEGNAEWEEYKKVTPIFIPKIF